MHSNCSFAKLILSFSFITFFFKIFSINETCMIAWRLCPVSYAGLSLDFYPSHSLLSDNITISRSSLNPTATQVPLPLSSNSTLSPPVALYVTRKLQSSVQDSGNLKHPFPDPQSSVVI